MEFTIDELIRLLYLFSDDEVALADTGADIADKDFADLGIDSLALFNAIHRIQRNYGIELPAEIVVELGTPRQLFNEVAKQLSPAVGIHT